MTDKASVDDTRSGDRFIPYDTSKKLQKKQQQQQQKDEDADLIPKLVANSAELLPDPEDPKFAEFIDRFADRRVILLGEASHGTSEFYRARAAITRRLVERHGFRLVCAEADWPDAAALNRYVRHWARVEFPRAVFQRFPTWMWRNVEVDELLHWLRKFNTDRDPSEQVGFYGLDLYNMNASITEVLNYLNKVDPEAAKLAKERYGCLQPWREEPANYGRASLLRGYAICEQGIVRQCKELLARELEYTAKEGNGQSFLDAAQNARLIQDAERYYRIMYYGGNESWNLRDTHMFETLEHLLRFHGDKSKAIVWAHNSHIGDARFTDMGDRRRQLNIGQLCRQRFGDQCALIGFGTNTGTVAAAEEWGDDMQIFPIRPSLPDSVERLCHDSGLPRFLLDLRPSERGGQQQTAEELRRRLLNRPRLERFIGVIYRPDTERWSHYSDTLLPKQFDAYIWFDHTVAVTPLGRQHAKPGMPDTYPFGL